MREENQAAASITTAAATAAADNNNNNNDYDDNTTSDKKKRNEYSYIDMDQLESVFIGSDAGKTSDSDVHDLLILDIPESPTTTNRQQQPTNDVSHITTRQSDSQTMPNDWVRVD